MSKLTICDRCGEISEHGRIVPLGTDEFYTAKIERHTYRENYYREGHHNFAGVDLCQQCGVEFDAIAQKFMEMRTGVKDNTKDQ